MVIVLPLGLLATAATFDLIGVATCNRQLLHASYYMLGAGLLTATGAAVPGAMDYFSIPPNTRAKRIGLLHGIGNLVVAGLFGASWATRRRRPADSFCSDPLSHRCSPRSRYGVARRRTRRPTRHRSP